MTKQFITSSVALSQSQRDLLARLRDLRLNGMALALATQWETMSVYSGMSFDERLRALLSEQENFSNTARAEYLLKRSNIPGHLELNSILASDDRNFKESLKAELATLNFVKQINNIIIMGQTSSGKSALACALGRLCCRRGLAAKYYRANDLLSELENSSYEKRVKTRNGLKRIKLLILDDLGLHPISETQCHMLFDVLDDRVNVGPVIISTWKIH